MNSLVRFMFVALAVSLFSGTAFASAACSSLSDLVLMGNTGPGGNLEVLAISDPSSSLKISNGTITYKGTTYTDSGISACEDPFLGGYVVTEIPINNINNSELRIDFFSDGEVYFDPCLAGYDTSDCIEFAGQPTPTAVNGGLDWNYIAPFTAWVLPASTGCGSENANICESIGDWQFADSAATGPIFMALYETPEPSSILFLGSGIVGLAGIARCRLR